MKHLKTFESYVEDAAFSSLLKEAEEKIGRMKVKSKDEMDYDMNAIEMQKLVDQIAKFIEKTKMSLSKVTNPKEKQEKNEQLQMAMKYMADANATLKRKVAAFEAFAKKIAQDLVGFGQDEDFTKEEFARYLKSSSGGGAIISQGMEEENMANLPQRRQMIYDLAMKMFGAGSAAEEAASDSVSAFREAAGDISDETIKEMMGQDEPPSDALLNAMRQVKGTPETTVVVGNYHTSNYNKVLDAAKKSGLKYVEVNDENGPAIVFNSKQ